MIKRIFSLTGLYPFLPQDVRDTIIMEMYREKNLAKLLNDEWRYNHSNCTKRSVTIPNTVLDKFPSALTMEANTRGCKDPFEMKFKIRSLVSLLPEKQREIIYMYFFEEKEIEEIARLIDHTPKEVRRLLEIALNNLKYRLSLQIQ